MASEERAGEILKELRDAVIHYDEDKTAEWAKITLNDGVDPFLAAIDGLAEGMIAATVQKMVSEFPLALGAG